MICKHTLGWGGIILRLTLLHTCSKFSWCLSTWFLLGGLSRTLMSSKWDYNILYFFVQFFRPPKSVCMHLQHRALQQIACFPHCLPPHRPFISCSRTCYCYSRFSEGSCRMENQVILSLLYYFNGTERAEQEFNYHSSYYFVWF